MLDGVCCKRCDDHLICPTNIYTPNVERAVCPMLLHVHTYKALNVECSHTNPNQLNKYIFLALRLAECSSSYSCYISISLSDGIERKRERITCASELCSCSVTAWSSCVQSFQCVYLCGCLSMCVG